MYLYELPVTGVGFASGSLGVAAGLLRTMLSLSRSQSR